MDNHLDDLAEIYGELSQYIALITLRIPSKKRSKIFIIASKSGAIIFSHDYQVI